MEEKRNFNSEFSKENLGKNFFELLSEDVCNFPKYILAKITSLYRGIKIEREPDYLSNPGCYPYLNQKKIELSFIKNIGDIDCIAFQPRAFKSLEDYFIIKKIKKTA